jgi:uncharacterized protein (TIGR03437 family)
MLVRLPDCESSRCALPTCGGQALGLRRPPRPPSKQDQRGWEPRAGRGPAPQTLAALALIVAASLHAATLGRTVAVPGGASDLVLDERRARVYLIASAQNQVQIYSTQRQTFDSPIFTDQTPLAAAISRDGKVLYVACYDSSLVDVIDLDTLAIINRVGLPARPEAIAVAADGRVLITTTGSGVGLTANSMLLYDPSPDAPIVLAAITITPPSPGQPVFPPPSSRPFLSVRSRLVATRDGAFIAGVNTPAAGGSTVYVYEAASRTVLRSRTVVGATTTVAISDDGTRVISGSFLFDAGTMQILANQNAQNVPYPLDPRTVFTLAANQGGSVFAPDSQTLYTVYNVAPIQNPAPNASQMMLADPDNLLVRMGIQLGDLLAGKMVISADGANIYALSDTGLAIIPVGTIMRSPLAVPSSGVVLLTRDACGVNPSTGTITINNPGTGRATANATLLQYAGLAGQAAPATAPAVRTAATATTSQLVFSFNATAARAMGTIAPAHDFVVQSPEAINIPDRIRVYENARDSDARGLVIPIATGIGSVPLPDLVYDQPRQRLYIANSGMNRVEVYDIRQQRLLAPVKVGQLPVSLALTSDGSTLYAANAGSEVISVIDPERMQTIGRVSFPPIAFNSALAPIFPNTIAWSSAGLQVLSANGALWRVVGETAGPRGVVKLIGQTPQGQPVAIPLPSTMASTPGGEYVLLATTTGFAYLYDSSVDDFIASRQIFAGATQTGYFGPIAAGPRGQYFVVNGTLLNSALAPMVSRPGLTSAVASMGNSVAVYSPPAAPAANGVPTVAPTLQVLDSATGAPLRQISALEGPLTTVAGNARTTIGGRTMAIDAAGTTAYIITASGLSVLSLTPVAASDRPVMNNRGAVNLGSYTTTISPNGLLSIFGQNLGAGESASSTPLPLILGGTCVTLNNIALPLFMVSPLQINAQIPPDLAAGSYPLIVRSIPRQAASVSQQLTISRYSPAVLMYPPTGQVYLFHEDGDLVTKDRPAKRDEHLTLYAVGLGATTGGRVTTGEGSPSNPLAVTGKVQVFFGDPRYIQSEVIVDWSGLTPGFVGLYQLNLRVPGFHEKGEALPVTLRVGGVDSPLNAPVVPYVSVE